LEKFLMKKTLIALAAVAAASASFAQVSLTGGVEVGYYKAVGASGIIGTDRGSFTNLAFTAKEDLGGGLSAAFYAQMRMDAGNGGPSSSKYGYPFEQIKTSLMGGFGQVDMGKYSLAVQTGWIRPLGSDDSLKAYSGTSTTRSPNQISYTSPSFGGAQIQVASIRGDDSAGNTGNDGTMTTLMYSANKLQAYVSVGNKVNKGTTNSADVGSAPAFTTVANAIDSTEIGVAYDLGMVKLGLGTTKEQASAGGNENTETAFLVEAPVGKSLKLGLGYSKFSTSVAGTGNDGMKKTQLVASYSLSKRTAVLVKALNVSGSAAAASNGSGSFLGVQHTF
jgi:predicted porin